MTLSVIGASGTPLSSAIPAPEPLVVVAPDVTLFVTVFELLEMRTPESSLPITAVPPAEVPM